MTGLRLPPLAAADKVAWHRERLAAFLRGEPLPPVAVELDLTTVCSRQCVNCPGSRASDWRTLDENFIWRLFDLLAGQARGLLISGGEATLSPHFPRVLERARRAGFSEIAVVTNGVRLDDARVREALLAHAAALRLSYYHFPGASGEEAPEIMRRLQALRRQADAQRSPLRLGVSCLTPPDHPGGLAEVAALVREAGAHWLYLHPRCDGWGTPALRRQAQGEEVQAEIRALTAERRPDFAVHFCPERYSDRPLAFSAYHAAHFLLVVGADGLNYLGPEAKYQPGQAIADFNGPLAPDTLRRPERLARIAAANSAGYPFLDSRHRSLLYNDFLERLRGGAPPPAARDFLFPHIL